jgi:hypothetical protein
MRWIFPLLTCAYCALIFYVSHQPIQVREEIDIPGLDKVVHAAIYAVLALLASQSLARALPAAPPRRRFWWPLLFAVLYGVSDEIHQSFIPAREFDPWDLVANSAGAAMLQLVLCLAWWRMPWRVAVLGQAAEGTGRVRA